MLGSGSYLGRDSIVEAAGLEHASGPELKVVFVTEV
jgi:hypothetical protein